MLARPWAAPRRSPSLKSPVSSVRSRFVINRADRAETPRDNKRGQNFAACGRAERIKPQIIALRAAVESVASSFRTVCLIFAHSILCATPLDEAFDFLAVPQGATVHPHSSAGVYQAFWRQDSCHRRRAARVEVSKLDVLAPALKALPTIARGPLAYLGYLLAVGAWLLAYNRNRTCSASLAQ